MFRRLSPNHFTALLAKVYEIPFNYTSRDDALKKITNLGREILHSHTCSIVLIDQERSLHTPIAWSTSNPEVERLLQKRPLHLGSGQPGDWLTLDPLRAGQLEVYDLPKTARALGIKSMLSYPLRINGSQVGRFNSFYGGRVHFSSIEQQLIQILGRLSIITLERFDHLQTVDHTLKVVGDLSKRLLSTEPKDFLQLIADKACELLSVPVSIIWRLDPDNRSLRIVAGSGDIDDDFRQLKMSIDEIGIKTRLGPKISFVANVENHPDIVNAVEIKKRRWVSLLCASLRVNDQPIGLLDVFTKKERQFSIWEKESFETFAQHAALSLQKGDLLKQAEGREKLEQLSEVMLNMTQARNVDELLDIFLKGGLHLVGAKNGLIRILNYPTGYTEVVTHSDDPPPTPIKLALGKGITGIALERGRPVRVGNLKAPEWQQVHVRAWSDEMLSELAIPIILNNTTVLVDGAPESGSKQIGVFNIESAEQDKFSETDEKCLQSLSRLAAIMIDRLEHDERVSKIEQFGREISDAQSYDEIAQILMRGIIDTLGFEYANISMVVPELGCIRSKHVVGIPNDQVERFKQLATIQLDSKFIEADIVRSGRVEVPLPGDERLNDKVIREFHLDLLSRVYVPMIEPSRNEVIGTIEAGYKKIFRPYIYERDVTTLKRLLAYAAQALQRRRSGILKKLSHELRMPIFGIRGNASFLQHRFNELDKEFIFTKFSDILADCEISFYQAAELEYVLGIRKQAKSKFRRTLVHKDIIIKTINQLKPEVVSRGFDHTKMQYRKEDAARINVPTDRAKLNQVVYNLLMNAIKYAERDPSQFTVRVEVDENRDFFIAKFKDWGIGVKKEYTEKIFEDGFRTPEARASHVTGSGLGLTISKLIMNELRGDLVLAGNRKPTEFHLIIPKRIRS